MRTLRLFGLLALLSGASLAHAQSSARAPEAAPQPAPPPAAQPTQYAQPPAQYAQPPVQYAQPPVQYAPPPPPGYGYPPPQDPAQRAALLGELSAVDARLQEAQRERSRHRIAGPIAMMSVGYGTGLIFAAVGLVQWSIAEDIESGDWSSYNGRNRDGYYSYYDDDRYDLNNDGIIDADDESKARRHARILAGMTAISTGIGIAGTVLLVQRLAKRRQVAPDLDRLRSRKLELLRNLQYGGGLSQNGLQLTLGGSF